MFQLGTCTFCYPPIGDQDFNLCSFWSFYDQGKWNRWILNLMILILTSLMTSLLFQLFLLLPRDTKISNFVVWRLLLYIQLILRHLSMGLGGLWDKVRVSTSQKSQFHANGNKTMEIYSAFIDSNQSNDNRDEKKV